MEKHCYWSVHLLLCLVWDWRDNHRCLSWKEHRGVWLVHQACSINPWDGWYLDRHTGLCQCLSIMSVCWDFLHHARTFAACQFQRKQSIPCTSSICSCYDHDITMQFIAAVLLLPAPPFWFRPAAGCCGMPSNSASSAAACSLRAFTLASRFSIFCRSPLAAACAGTRGQTDSVTDQTPSKQKQSFINRPYTRQALTQHMNADRTSAWKSRESAQSCFVDTGKVQFIFCMSQLRTWRLIGLYTDITAV